MERFEFRKFSDEKIDNGVAIIGFPSLGLVSSIASGLISKSENMDLFAGISSPLFPPYCVMQNGVPGPQVRIYRRCREEGGLDCDDLLVVNSESIPRAEYQQELAKAMMEWFKENGVGTVIALDSIPFFDSTEYKTVCACSNAQTQAMAEEFGLQPLTEGIVRGFSGTLLYEGALLGLRTMVAIGNSKSEMPDPRGAAKLLESLSGLLPELSVDTEPLYGEAEEMEKRIAEAMNETAPGDRILYG